MATYKELLERRVKLDAQLEQLRNEARDSVIAEIRQKMSDYQITPGELEVKQKIGRQGRGLRRPVAAKYRDPATGREWNGLGNPPNWIKNAANRDEFLTR